MSGLQGVSVRMARWTDTFHIPLSTGAHTTARGRVVLTLSHRGSRKKSSHVAAELHSNVRDAHAGDAAAAVAATAATVQRERIHPKTVKDVSQVKVVIMQWEET